MLFLWELHNELGINVLFLLLWLPPALWHFKISFWEEERIVWRSFAALLKHSVRISTEEEGLHSLGGSSQTRSWRWMVCKQGITQFFCMGYAALDVKVWSRGFTIFMFPT
jgi:hypothetical protein